jgi:hypothetical protein
VRILGILSAIVPATLCAVLGSAQALADGATSAPENQPGVWQKHAYSFVFMGFTTTYSCDGLASKLKILLIAAGARADVKSFPGACASGFGRPDKFARADLTFYTLAPPGSDKAADAPPVTGQWKSVALATRKPRELGLGDCELVDQFRTSVLPMFTTRNVDNHMTCIPHQDSGSVIDLKFDSFTAVPKANPRAAPQ